MVFNDFLVGFLSYLTIIADVFILLSLVFVSYSFLKKRKVEFPLFIKRNSLTFAFIVALVSTVASLFFSEILNYVPCELCWVQRVFMYPLVFLIGFGLMKKSVKAINYTILLSFIGGLIAIYHNVIQALDSSDFCTIDGAGCLEKFVVGYGYVTIPIMAITSFVLVIIFCFIWKNYVKSKVL